MRKRDKDKDRQLPRHTSIVLVVSMFVVFLLAASVLISTDQVFVPVFEQGDISQRDVFAPFDFSFADPDGTDNEVKRNEMIIQRGERISPAQSLALTKLRELQWRPQRLYSVLGLILLIIIFAAVADAYVRIHASKLFLKTANILLVVVLSLLIVITAKGIIISSWSEYLIPLASVSMLAAILLDPEIAMMVTILLSAYIGMIAGARFDLMLMLFCGGAVSIYSVLNVKHRRSLTKAGFLIGLTNAVTIIAVGLMQYESIYRLVVQGGWGLANGIISGFVVTGILPIFEMGFGITTNISLLELSDLNQPVLKELVMKAPGTYHHSLVVGNLAESAAEAVGANNLLARVGAYFHDIGKLRMAPYFNENQPRSENKHDTLSPTISSLIIINHVKEGAELAKKYRLGTAIQDIISQHHGNDIVHYFYHRALEKNDDETAKVQVENFRYPGPRPQSKEAAIVMLADSVEAASRSMQQPSPAKIKELVNRIINNKFIDGQLDECDLTLKDLHRISGVFSHILNGIFHTRVEYPELKIGTHEQNNNKESAEKSKHKPARAKKPGESGPGSSSAS